MSRLDGMAFGSLGRGSSNGIVSGITFGSWGKIVDDFLALVINSPAFDVAFFLEDAGLGTREIDIFVGREPETPDNTITIYDTGGFPPNPKYLRDNPSVQIKVRSATDDRKIAADILKDIRNVLLNSGDRISGGSIYIQYYEFGGIIDLGVDKQGRFIMVSNYRLVRTLSITTNRE